MTAVEPGTTVVTAQREIDRLSGRFISFEGGEGAGKSTQARMLADALRAQGTEVVITREPGGTPGAEAIRTLLLTTEGTGWNARAEALLFAAARSDHVERLIAPALARGAWVVCDRYLDSSRAYQGGGGGLTDADLLALHAIGSSGLLPHRTVLLTLDPAIAATRIALRDGDAVDRIGGRDRAYHDRVDAAFRAIARTAPDRFVQIDASRNAQAIHRDILASLAADLPA
ncbi:dTMP kinase [Novosphingobium sp.]|uniref:dTMP kinase n=1 Tax=Novosphingobium sp. TaxID=1874826 RepID=UPI0025E70970|nr:dTMP kinase [Novosphingobium sp.]